MHFPYCLEKCPYCDFVSYKVTRPDIDHRGYADAVLAEARARVDGNPRARDFVVTSVFFGGGTPSLWEPEELGRVLAGLGELLVMSDDLETTVECNPTSLDRDRARTLREVGVTRLSIGTQSLQQDALQYLGRMHSPDGALAAIEGAREVGPARLSTDLIFGLPGQTPDDARAQATELAARGLTHLSCYQLTIEPGTRFGELARRGRLPLADDGLVAESFLAIDEGLTSAGFTHYEISNYAKPGQEARHNLSYWHGREYLGLGCGAYGYLRYPEHGGGGLRYRNQTDPATYMQHARNAAPVPAGASDGVSVSAEALDAGTLLRERIMLGLRLATGFDLEAAAADLGADALPDGRARALERLLQSGRLQQDGRTLRIPKASWLFTDDIAARLF